MKKVNPFGLQAITNALEFLLQKMESVFIYHNSHIINDLWLFGGESCREFRAIRSEFSYHFRANCLLCRPWRVFCWQFRGPITEFLEGVS
jgi:hypothetical protein